MPTMLNTSVPKYTLESVRRPRHPDPEAQSTTPMLCDNHTNADYSSIASRGSTSTNGERKSKRKRYLILPSILDFFWGGVYAPGASTYDPIEILLNAEDEEERDRLTENWRDNRLNELSFVGVVAALLAGVLTSTGSWPTILPNGKISPWPVRTAWYCGIILSVFAILTAADQTVRLYRMSSHRDGPQQIRAQLGKSNGKNRKRRLRPSMAQLYTWQMPVMFLTTAAVCMIVGMFLHVWSAVRNLNHENWWSDDARVAVVFTVVGGISIVIFFLGQLTLYVPQQGIE